MNVINNINSSKVRRKEKLTSLQREGEAHPKPQQCISSPWCHRGNNSSKIDYSVQNIPIKKTEKGNGKNFFLVKQALKTLIDQQWDTIPLFDSPQPTPTSELASLAGALSFLRL